MRVIFEKLRGDMSLKPRVVYFNSRQSLFIILPKKKKKKLQNKKPSLISVSFANKGQSWLKRSQWGQQRDSRKHKTLGQMLEANHVWCGWGWGNSEGNCLKIFKAPNLLYPASESRYCLIFTYCILSETVIAFHLLQPSFFSPSFTHPVLFIHITFRLPHIPSTTTQGNVGKAFQLMITIYNFIETASLQSQ